jgi:LysM repeat protein
MAALLKLTGQAAIIRLLASLTGAALLLAAGFFSLGMAAAQGPCGQSYTVVYGDTLNQIAARCDTTVPALLKANPGLDDPNLIHVGSRLAMPLENGGDPDEIYTVKPGDTLGQIAAQVGTTVSALVRANSDITDPNLITVGQRLTIPQSPEPGQPTVTISPTRGSPGATLQITARGLPPTTSLQVGTGQVNTEFEAVDRVSTDRQGRFRTALTIPHSAQSGESWVVVVRQGERGGLTVSSNIFRVTAPQSRSPVTTSARIYLVALEDGGRLGPQIGCGDSLVPVQVTLKAGDNAVAAVLAELLAIGSRRYGPLDLYNALHSSALQVKNVTVETGQSVVNLTGEVNLGGVCDSPRFRAQLEETVRQFPVVDQVSIFINDRPLDRWLSQK